MVDVVPGAVGQDEVEAAQSHLGVAPDRRRGLDADLGQGGPHSGQSSRRSGNRAPTASGHASRPAAAAAPAQLADGEVAGHLVAGRDLPHFGDLLGAAGLGPGAAGAEAAARGGLIGLGGSPVSATGVRGGLGVRLDGGREQRRRVVVGRRLVEDVGGGDLAQAPQVHDGHPVADVLHHGQVVRDEEDGQVVLLLQVLEQVEDLRLHRDVEGRDDLVAHQQLRLEHQGPGDADALALAARELAGPAVAVDVGVDARPGRAWRSRVSTPLLLGADLPDVERLGHDVDDPPARVERGDRVLEDHLHLRAQRAQVAAARASQLGVAEDDLARGRPSPPGRWPGRWSTCRSPTRRRGRASRPGCRVKRDAGHGLHGALPW